MAGGAFAAAADDSAADSDGNSVTASALLTCSVAASGGLLFGYDMGITGGVTTMKPFLRKFFPAVLGHVAAASSNTYCVYNNQTLTTFTSSMYLAALLSSLAAGRLTMTVGRRAVMIAAGALCLAGAAINAGACNVMMLIVGRLLLGLGIGFANQATPIYIAEMAPARRRGAFIAAFQISISLGTLIASLINYAAIGVNGDGGWRLALGFAGAPATVFLLGAIAISDTPASLASRGRLSSAREALLRTRGPEGDGELDFILRRLSRGRGGVFRRRYRQYLFMGVMIMAFQQMTGINLVAFYAPALLQSVGFGSRTSLLGTAVLSAIGLGSLVASTFVVDRYGRKVLFIVGGVQMLLCQAALGAILLATVGGDGSAQLPLGGAVAVLLLLCVYCVGYGWSWGPLCWIVPAEIYPVEIRPTGQAITVAVNFLLAFVQAQAMLAALCLMKYGLFFFFAGWIVLMTVFVAALLPETKGVSIESMEELWATHWFWRRFAKSNGSPPAKEVS